MQLWPPPTHPETADEAHAWEEEYAALRARGLCETCARKVQNIVLLTHAPCARIVYPPVKKKRPLYPRKKK